MGVWGLGCESRFRGSGFRGLGIRGCIGRIGSVLDGSSKRAHKGSTAMVSAVFAWA